MWRQCSLFRRFFSRRERRKRWRDLNNRCGDSVFSLFLRFSSKKNPFHVIVSVHESRFNELFSPAINVLRGRGGVYSGRTVTEWQVVVEVDRHTDRIPPNTSNLWRTHCGGDPLTSPGVFRIPRRRPRHETWTSSSEISTRDLIDRLVRRWRIPKYNVVE